MKKITALIAALVLSLAMCVTAFAEDTTDYTFTESDFPTGLVVGIAAGLVVIIVVIVVVLKKKK